MSALRIKVGYIPLLDAAPLFVADALGFAGEEGLTLDLTPAPSWSALRDMLALGLVDAAQMLSPVPVAMALGLGGMAARFDALQVLSANGDVIGVSNTLAQRMRDDGHDFSFDDAAATGRALAAAAGDTLRIGVPFPFSMHSELVHYWLEGLALPLRTQVQIHTVPPPLMAQAMAADAIDAFAVGEPWGSVAVENGVGTLVLPGAAIWSFAPEKVLAVRQGWADQQPDLAGRLMRAIWRAGRWLGAPENQVMIAEIVTAPGRLDVPSEIVDRAISGRLIISQAGEERIVPQMIDFFGGAATFPWRSQAAWIGARLARRHNLPVAEAVEAARAVFRTDLYRRHLGPAGADLPGASEKVEGAFAQPNAVASVRGRMILPRDEFFDRRVFDPHLLN